MAGMTDVLTTAQNIVQAINGMARAFLQPYGNLTSVTVTADTLICVGQGRLVNVSVVVAGSSDGTLYNSSTIAGVAAENALSVAPSTNVGVYPLGQVFTAGLVVSPGTGQSLNVTYFQ